MTAQGDGLLHPNEDLLAAFAERSLMPLERQEVLAHLVACQRCRDIVFLAHEVTPERAADAPREAVLPEFHGSGLKGSRLSGSRLRLLWALALTAVVVVLSVAGFQLRRSQHSREAQTASETASETATPNESTAKQHELPQTTELQQSKAVVRLRRAKPVHRSLPVPVPEIALDTFSSATAQQQTPPSGKPQRSEQMHGAIFGVAAGRLGAAKKPPSLSDSVSAGSAAVAILQPAPENFMPPPPPPTVPASPPPPRSMVSGMARGVPIVQPVFRIHDGAILHCIGDNCIPRPLPGSAVPVSVASLRSAVLALDSDGNLFLSADKGDIWNRVDRQWQGKAVSVQLTAWSIPRDIRGEKDISTDKSASTDVPLITGMAGAQPTFFTLFNEKGQKWISVDDGRTWQPE